MRARFQAESLAGAFAGAWMVGATAAGAGGAAAAGPRGPPPHAASSSVAASRVEFIQAAAARRREAGVQVIMGQSSSRVARGLHEHPLRLRAVLRPLRAGRSPRAV